MSKSRPVAAIAIMGMAALISGAAMAASDAAPKKEDPIRITAKRMEVKAEQNAVIFEDDVVAVQGTMTISADRIKVITRKDESRPGPSGDPAENRKVQEIIATGNVQFRQLVPEEKIERFATGQKAQYWDEEGKLVLTGEPRAWENDNIITGEVMTFYTRQNLFKVDGKVKVIFYPEEGMVDDSAKPAPPAPAKAPAVPETGAADPGKAAGGK